MFCSVQQIDTGCWGYMQLSHTGMPVYPRMATPGWRKSVKGRLSDRMG